LAKADTAFQAHPSVNRLNLGLSEQIGAGLREPDERSTLVHHQPAALDQGQLLCLAMSADRLSDRFRQTSQISISVPSSTTCLAGTPK